MSTAPAFGSATEAAKTARAALGFLAAVDPTRLMTEEQAQCLHALEQVNAMSTAAFQRHGSCAPALPPPIRGPDIHQASSKGSRTFARPAFPSPVAPG
jgi:hypothetical protein